MSKGSEGLRLQSDHDDVRLAVSTSEGLSNPIISEPVVSANNRIHYINMVFCWMDSCRIWAGQFRTYPNAAKSFTCNLCFMCQNRFNKPCIYELKRP